MNALKKTHFDTLKLNIQDTKFISSYSHYKQLVYQDSRQMKDSSVLMSRNFRDEQ